MQPSPADQRASSDASTAAVPAFYKRRKRRGNELGQVLLRRGTIAPEQLREALRIQSEQGGQIGSILVQLGACDTQAIAEALIEQVQTARTSARELARRARNNPAIVGLEVGCRPRLTVFVLLAGDALITLGASMLSGFLFSVPLVSNAIVSGVVMAVTVFALAAAHLHEIPPPAPPEEIRRATHIVSLTMLGFGVATLLLDVTNLSPLGWAVTWALTVFLLPATRGILRSRLAGKPWWGRPVVVLGAGKAGRKIVALLRERPGIGLKPIAILDDDPARQGTLRARWEESDITVESVRSDGVRPLEAVESSSKVEWGRFSEVEGVPIIGALALAPMLVTRLKIRSAIVAMPEADSSSLVSILENYTSEFTSVLIIPDVFELVRFGGVTRSFDQMLGIEMRRQLLLSGPRMMKRAMDVVLTAVGVLAISPLLVLIGLWIKLDSKGPVFYRQQRLGQDGVRFTALKFRTMHGDGEARLQAVLDSDPKLKAEYEYSHKIANDPRVTRAGRWLRKYSLDELPQLWNVLVGEMSLVGPRPYLDREIPEMAQQEIIVLRVKPGLTGVWQVMERNSSNFARRVQLDVEYVRNWSPWLDIYVVARTVPVVLGGTGS
ncbi:MAG TPA: exopolysaccharide biosynthesis polyprenyl glycosylphosphotransferase [Polyangiaceae bacterium]